jgi:hypothetical protein
LKRCVVLAPPGAAGQALLRALLARGIECRVADVPARGRLSRFALDELATADFVATALPDDAAPLTTFALGIAHALHKPLLAFTAGPDPLLDGLPGTYVVRRSPDAYPDLSGEIDRFLRFAQPSQSQQGPPRSASRDLGWAREQARQVAHLPLDRQGPAFESLVAGLLKAAGDQAVAVRPGADRGVDLVVWHDDLVFDTGGPLLIACRTSGANLPTTMVRLAGLVAASDASLALVVVPDAVQPPPASLLVQVMPIGTLIDALERGDLVHRLLDHQAVARLQERTGAAA